MKMTEKMEILIGSQKVVKRIEFDAVVSEAITARRTKNNEAIGVLSIDMHETHQNLKKAVASALREIADDIDTLA